MLLRVYLLLSCCTVLFVGACVSYLRLLVFRVTILFVAQSLGMLLWYVCLSVCSTVLVSLRIIPSACMIICLYCTLAANLFFPGVLFPCLNSMPMFLSASVLSFNSLMLLCRWYMAVARAFPKRLLLLMPSCLFRHIPTDYTCLCQYVCHTYP